MCGFDSKGHGGFTVLRWPTPGLVLSATEPKQIQSLMRDSLLRTTEGLQLKTALNSERRFEVKNSERRLSIYMAAPWENT